MEELSEILRMKRSAVALGLCGRYRSGWDSAVSREDLVRLALDANGAAFLADAMAFGWGLTEEFIIREFGPYINGRHVVAQDGYTSEMYVGHVGAVKARTTLIFCAGCDISLEVDKLSACEIYCVRTKMRAACDGFCTINEYGDGNGISVSGTGKVRIRPVTASGWRRGETM